MFSAKKKRLSSERAFSLMELLIVLAIFPVIAFTIFASFGAGIRLWKTVHQEVPEEAMALFTVKMDRDLRGVVPYKPIAFIGQKDSLSFAGRVQAPVKLGGNRAFGEVRIYYDEASRTISREERNISESYKESAPRRNVLLTDVHSAEFSFFEPGSNGQPAQWVEEWTPDLKTLPVAVKVVFEAGPGRRNETLVFRLPVGG